jgi:hypothetical protein
VRPEREVQKGHTDPTTRSFASIFKEFRRPTRFIEKPHELLSRNGSPILAAHIGRQSEGGFDCSKLGCLELRLSDVPPSRKRHERKCFRDLANHGPQLREITVEANRLGAIRRTLPRQSAWRPRLESPLTQGDQLATIS